MVSLYEAYQTLTQDEISRGIAREWWAERSRRGQGSSSRTGAVARPAAFSSTGASLARSGIVAAHAVVGQVHQCNTSTSDVGRQLEPEQVTALLSLLNPSPHDTLQVGRVSLPGGLILTQVLYVPHLNCSFLSVSQLTYDINCCVRFTNSLCAIQDQRTGTLIGASERKEGLYYFRGISTVCAVTVPGFSSFELWHRRLGHPSDRVLKLVPEIKATVVRSRLTKACDICPQAKQTRDSFPSSDSKASSIFELIHCDFWGPNKTESFSGVSYFFTIVDDFSRVVWVYLLHSKFEVNKVFRSFFVMIQRQFESTVKIVRSDNGTEFQPLKDYFDENEIIFRTSCVGTPQQNGLVERKHRHILNVTRALMFQGNLPLTFWGECVLVAVYLINHTLSSVFGGKSPYEMLFNIAPYLGHLRGWKVYDLASRDFFVSRDVTFHEANFRLMWLVVRHLQSLSNLLVFVDEDDEQPVSVSFDKDDEAVPATSHVAPMSLDSNAAIDQDDIQQVASTDQAAHEEADVVAPPATFPASPSTETLGRGLHTKHPSVLLQDYVTHTLRKLSTSPSSSPSSRSSGIPYPLTHCVNCNQFSLGHPMFLAAVFSGVEPRSYSEAVKDVGCRDAMNK
ncbi:hypothetical protein LIER_33496 [Lithospermum erythrorhizon]|uniref:Integrase catalytic domain-containing protein n=1 Tax=Lithospermum erythrorhizon TaxID=34254 RepID=A0AAV3RWW5_LITER